MVLYTERQVASCTRIQSTIRRRRALIHCRARRAIIAIIRKQIETCRSALCNINASQEHAALQEAGRKARAFMDKSARPMEKVLSDQFLDALEAQIRGECEPLGPVSAQCSHIQSNGESVYVSLNFDVSDNGSVRVGIDDARSAKAREILSLFENARKSGLAHQRLEREHTEQAYRQHLQAHGISAQPRIATSASVPYLRTASAHLIESVALADSHDPPCDFEVTTASAGIQTPAYLQGVKACGKNGLRHAIHCLLMGDSGSGTCIAGEQDFHDLERRGLARRTRKLSSSVEQIAGIGAVNLVLFHATFTLDFGGAVVRFTDVPVLSGHRGILIGNDFHRTTRAAYDFARCTDATGTLHDGHVILRGPDLNAVSQPIYFSHSFGQASSNTASASLAESAVPLVYNPEAVSVDAWSEAMLQVRVPAAAVAGYDVAVVPLDDERLEGLPVMVAPCLARPDKDGFIWIRVINPSQQRVRISQLTPLARFIVDPKITGADLEFTTEEIIDKITIEPGCSEVHRADIRHMLETRRRLFASKLGVAHGYQHDIAIGAHETPPHLPARRLSPEEYSLLKEAIDKQLKAGLLEYCTSPYNARPMCVPKFGGGQRVVIDYRMINEQILRSKGGSRYPLPNLDANLNSLAKAKWFTAVDLLSGFHQVELTDRAKLVTAFSTPWGQMCYSRLPMGLTSSPGAFMMVVDSALRGLPPGIAVAYLDDILIPTDGTWDDHMRDVGLVMDRLIEAGFTVNPKKVFMGMRETPYLGYIVGAYGTKPNPERTKAIFDLMFENVSADAGAAARFTGMISFYARFIKNIHITLAPFHALKGKGANVQLILQSLEIRAAFVLLKHQLATVTALTRPNYNQPFHVHVDMASSVGIGAALMQHEDETDPTSLRPIAFWSHKFTDTERGWSVRDQECYGLVRALEEWRPYVLGSHTVVKTDHKSLQWFMRTQHADGTRVQGWVARIQHYDIDIQYIPGKEHLVADFFSRASGRSATASIAYAFTVEATRSALIATFNKILVSPTSATFTASCSAKILPSLSEQRTYCHDALCSVESQLNKSLGRLPNCAQTALALTSSTVRLIALFVPIWHDGVLHTLTCSYQGELALPATATYVKCSRRFALRSWLDEVLEPHSFSLLQPLLDNAQSIAPQSDTTLPTYFVTTPQSHRLDITCKPASGFSITTSALNLGSLPPFSTTADTAFCLRYLIDVARKLSGPCGTKEWRIYLLRNRHYRPPSPVQVLTAAAFDGLPRIGQTGVSAEGPFFCDTLSDVIEVERQVTADLNSTHSNVLALDLEGNLGGPRPHVALLQLKSPSRLIVVDTHRVSSALSPRPEGLRAMIENPDIVKVVHCCYGDASALRVEHGISLRGAFDTGIADAILRGFNANTSRGLGTVLVDWLKDKAIHLTHKGKLVHTPFMFNERPLTLEHFVYSAEDVEHCIDLYDVMRPQLQMLGLLELVFTLSDDRCTPTKEVSQSSCTIVIAVVDATSLLCIEAKSTGLLELPSAAFDPECTAALSQREAKHLLRDTWIQCMGQPPAVNRFATTVGAQLRNPKRLGSTYLSYGVTADINAIIAPLRAAFAAGPLASSHDLRVVPRRLQLSQHAIIRSDLLVTFQCISYDTALGVASPRRLTPSRGKVARLSAALVIQRFFKRRFALAHTALSHYASQPKFASTELSALVLFCATHVFVLKGPSPTSPWRLPWSIINGSSESASYDAALAGFDRYAGPAARKLPSDPTEHEWCVMPRTAALINVGLSSSVSLGRAPDGAINFWTCRVDSLPSLATSLVASRREKNGFRLSPTEHKRHPIAMLALHATALQHLQPDDAWALRRALDVLPPPLPAHVKATAVASCVDIILPCSPSKVGPTDLPPLTYADTSIPQVALAFDKALQAFNSSQVSAFAFASPLISEMLGYTASKLDRVASRIQADLDFDNSSQPDVDSADTDVRATAGDDSRHSGPPASTEPLGVAVENDDSNPSDTNLPRAFKYDPDDSAASGVPGSLPMPSLQQLADAQRAHPATAQHIEYKLTGVLPHGLLPEQFKTFITEASFIELCSQETADGDSVCVLRRRPKHGSVGPIILPPQYRPHVLRTFHDKQGHLGVSKVWPTLRRLYWWPKARDDLRNYIKLCRVCRRIKVDMHAAGEQHITHHGSSPWTDVTVDVYDVGWSSDGFTKIVSFNDHLGRGVLSCPLTSDYTAEDIADIVVGYLIRFKGRPLRIHSDRGSTLIAEVIKQLYSKYEISMEAGMAFNHNSAALTERWHRVLKSLLATHRLASKDDRWHLYLPLLEVAFNNTVNATTGFTPFFVEHLRHADVPSDLSSGRPHHGAPLKDYVVSHIERAQLVWAVVAHELDSNSLNAKAAVDLKREHKIQYAPGQQVLLVRGDYIDSNLPKAEEPTQGPYTVLRALKGGQYVLGDLRSRRMHDVVTEKRLLPYPSRRLNSDAELAERYTVERVVDRRLSSDGTTLLYRIRWSGFDKSYDSWRSMDYLHEIAPLVAAYNRLVPLPHDHMPSNLQPVQPDVVQPPPNPAALTRRHFRALDGGALPMPSALPETVDLLATYPVGTAVEMLYDEDGSLKWYAGKITRCKSARSRDLKPDLSYSIRFDGYPNTYGPYKLSCNSLRLVEDAPTSDI